MSTDLKLLQEIESEVGVSGIYDPDWVLKTLLEKESKVVIITPELAQNLLDGTSADVQRPIKKSNLTRYIRDMKEDRWVMNEIPIYQDKNGNIFDGQHRLLACVKSGKPFVTRFIKGVDREKYVHTLDVGMTRTLADTIAIAQMGQVAYTPTVAGAIEFLLRYQNNTHGYSGNRGDTATNQIMIQWIDTHPENFQEIVELTNLDHEFEALMGFKYLVAMHYLFRRIDAKKAEKYVRGVLTGINLTEQSPALYVRNKLIKAKMSGNRLDKLNWRDKLVLLIRGWNDYYTNNGEMASTKYNANVKVIPEVAGAKKLKLFD